MVARRAFSCVGLVAILALASGCATLNEPKVRADAPPGGYSASSPDQGDSATSRNVSGVWEGTGLTDCTALQFANRCNAVVNVTLTMLQEQERVTGFYRCATGTVMCRQFLDTGVIKAGSMTGRLLRFRVMLDDGESCIFQATPQPDRIAGAYLCLNGAAIQLFTHGTITGLLFLLVGNLYDKAHTRMIPDFGGMLRIGHKRCCRNIRNLSTAAQGIVATSEGHESCLLL